VIFTVSLMSTSNHKGYNSNSNNDNSENESLDNLIINSNSSKIPGKLEVLIHILKNCPFRQKRQKQLQQAPYGV